MVAKTAAVLAIAAAFAGTLVAVEDKASVKVGDLIVLEMTGELAVEYSRRVGTLNPGEDAPSGLSITTMATVDQQLENGQLRIEHSRRCVDRDNKPRLVTLTAIVDATQITEYVIPRGPAQRSPSDPQQTQIDEDKRGVRVELSDLKRLKLRTWSLTEEIGD
jgi:hypothetical protein